MPRRNYDSREDIHALQKFMHRGKIFMTCKKLHIAGRYSCPTRSHAHPEKELRISRGNNYPSTSIAFYFSRLDAKRTIRDDIQRNISIASFLFIFTSNEEYISDYIANITNNLYLLYVKPIC